MLLQNERTENRDISFSLFFKSICQCTHLLSVLVGPVLPVWIYDLLTIYDKHVVGCKSCYTFRLCISKSLCEMGNLKSGALHIFLCFLFGVRWSNESNCVCACGFMPRFACCLSACLSPFKIAHKRRVRTFLIPLLFLIFLFFSFNFILFHFILLFFVLFCSVLKLYYLSSLFTCLLPLHTNMNIYIPFVIVSFIIRYYTWRCASVCTRTRTLPALRIFN